MPKRHRGSRRALAELLFWPALLLYGEAAVGYFGDMRRPGRAGRAATWGVRLGWLAQTALLVVQATRDDGFPWGPGPRRSPSSSGSWCLRISSGGADGPTGCSAWW